MVDCMPGSQLEPSVEHLHVDSRCDLGFLRAWCPGSEGELSEATRWKPHCLFRPNLKSHGAHFCGIQSDMRKSHLKGRDLDSSSCWKAWSVSSRTCGNRNTAVAIFDHSLFGSTRLRLGLSWHGNSLWNKGQVHEYKSAAGISW